jgi:hypothetical protein
MQTAEQRSELSHLLRVFLCHSSEDKPAVRRLCSRLVSEGFDPWLDEKRILPGHDWRHEIAEAVRSADVVIVCLSRSSMNKEGYVQQEIKDALDLADEKPEGTIFIIPVKLEECEVLDRLRNWQWVNLFEKGGYEKLLRSLQVRSVMLNLTKNRTLPSTVDSQSKTEVVSTISSSSVPGSPKATWRPWGDYPPYVILAAVAAILGGIVALITIITFVTGKSSFRDLLHDSTDSPRPVLPESPTRQLSQLYTPNVPTYPITPIATTTVVTSILEKAKLSQIDEFFPLYIGSTWRYNFGTIVWAIGEKAAIGEFVERVVMTKQLTNGVRIVGVEQTGEERLKDCGYHDMESGLPNVWLVVDQNRLYRVCSEEDARRIADYLVLNARQQATPIPDLPTPDYIVPFQLGNKWPDITPRRDDTYYAWFVGEKVDVTVPAGEFKDCYRIEYFTLPSETIRWVCPGIGLVAAQYSHHGTRDDYRLELAKFEIKAQK